MATITAAGGAAGNWTDGSAWIGGVAPTAADDAVIPLATTSITITAGSLCRSADFNTFTGTITMGSTGTLTIGDATAGTGNIALRLPTGGTFVPNASSTITFLSSSATQQTISVGTYTLGKVTFGSAAVGGNYLFSTGITSSTTVTLTRGTLNTNGQTCSWGTFVTSGSDARTLTMGASSITITESTVNAWVTGATNLTITANTATATLSGATSTFTGGSTNWNGLSVVMSGSGAAQISDNNTFANITRTGTAVKTGTFVFSGNNTITGTLTINGNSSINRILVTTNTIGTARTLTAATVSVTNADFRDITGAGAGSWDLSAITGLSGDCGGNSGITFTTAGASIWNTTGGGNWSDVSQWDTRVPLPQDDAQLDALFFSSPTVTADMPRLAKSISFAGSFGTVTFSLSGTAVTIYGSLTLTSNVTVSSVHTLTFEGRGSHTITSAGKSFNLVTGNLTFAAVGGTYTLQDAFSQTGNSFYHQYGTFDANGFNFTALLIANNSSTSTRALSLGSGTWTLTFSSGSLWNQNSATGLTINASTSTIYFSDAGASGKTFIGAGKTYYDFKIAGGGAGSITITGANTFNRIYTNGGGTKSIVLPGSTTTTLISGLGLGNGSNVITFTASSGSATVSKSSGILSWNYVNLTNIPSTGGATFYAGANSTDGGGNTGWIFFNAPSSGGASAAGAAYILSTGYAII